METRYTYALQHGFVQDDGSVKWVADDVNYVGRTEDFLQSEAARLNAGATVMRWRVVRWPEGLVPAWEEF